MTAQKKAKRRPSAEPGSANLRSRLKEATAQEIMRAAETVLADQGYVASSMASIAHRAGVSVGTLYNHFKDKDELFTKLLTFRRSQMQAHLDAAAARLAKSAFAEHLRGVVRAVFETFDEQRDFLRVWFDVEQISSPGLRSNARNKKERPIQQFVDRLQPIVDKGIKEKLIRKEGSDLYAWMLAGMLRSIMFQRLHESEKSFVDETDNVVAVFLHGVMRDK